LQERLVRVNENLHPKTDNDHFYIHLGAMSAFGQKQTPFQINRMTHFTPKIRATISQDLHRRAMLLNEYEFTLNLRLPDDDADPEQHVEALYRMGCGDATVGIGRRGRIALRFARESRSADEAVSSALRDVRAAIPGIELVEVEHSPL
jgi:hypothetical protein